MIPLLADIVFFVVAVALGGVEGDGGGAAGAFVALVVVGNRRDGFGQGFCHASSPSLGQENAERRGVFLTRLLNMTQFLGLYPASRCWCAVLRWSTERMDETLAGDV
jgi:hypothetical protein